MPASPNKKLVTQLLKLADELSESLAKIDFSSTTRWIYNPLIYARAPYRQYLERYAHTEVQNVYMGMNPGPWGMAQTGIPFGEVNVVREWLFINADVVKPPLEHPKRPIVGFDCKRSEVSGRRLWSLFRDQCETADRFFQNNFILNYCPLVFMDESGRNITPDKLPKFTRQQLHDACDQHLLGSIRLLQPTTLIGIGNYAYECFERLVAADSSLGGIKCIKILHPSPASPQSNHRWAELVIETLNDAGVLPN